jgi:hypothetical protein
MPIDMPNAADNLTNEQRALLNALDTVEWRTVGYRLGPFHPWMAKELVDLGLAERRPRAKKRGAFEYRRIRPVGDAVQDVSRTPKIGLSGARQARSAPSGKNASR